jgi:plasmid stability protein
MGQALIRNLDDDVMDAYKTKARLNGTSMEFEFRKAVVNAAPLTSIQAVKLIEEHQQRLKQCSFALPADFDSSAAIRWGRDDEFDK